MERMDIPATVRASIGMYNDYNDIDSLIEAINVVHEIFN